MRKIRSAKAMIAFRTMRTIIEIKERMPSSLSYKFMRQAFYESYKDFENGYDVRPSDLDEVRVLSQMFESSSSNTPLTREA